MFVKCLICHLNILLEFWIKTKPMSVEITPKLKLVEDIIFPKI